jgi:hypothetical protein
MVTMQLSEFVSTKRREVFEALSAGKSPPIGEFDEGVFRSARDRGKPQMGPVTYQPEQIVFDFIYPGGSQAALVLTVRVKAPERIVYMAVPTWVVEQIWQGDVQGSYHFAEEAKRLLSDYSSSLEPESNADAFGPAPSFKRG